MIQGEKLLATNSKPVHEMVTHTSWISLQHAAKQYGSHCGLFYYIEQGPQKVNNGMIQKEKYKDKI